MAKSIIVVGDPVTGYDFIGPFNSPDEAIQYAEQEHDRHVWHLAPLKQPEIGDNDNEQKGKGPLS